MLTIDDKRELQGVLSVPARVRAIFEKFDAVSRTSEQSRVYLFAGDAIALCSWARAKWGARYEDLSMMTYRCKPIVRR